MAEQLGTVATQALQLWLRDDEARSGGTPERTVSGYRALRHLGLDDRAARGRDWPADDAQRRSPTSARAPCRRAAAGGRRRIAGTGARARAGRRDRVPQPRRAEHLPPAAHAAIPLGAALCGDRSNGARPPAPPTRASTPSTAAPTSTPRTATCSHAGHRPVPAPGRRERIRQPGPRRRLDRLWASTPGASRRRSCRASRPPTPCCGRPPLDRVAGYYQTHREGATHYAVRSTMKGTSARRNRNAAGSRGSRRTRRRTGRSQHAPCRARSGVAKSMLP